MLTVMTARQPVWNEALHTSLNLLVTFEETAQMLGEMPFTASADDCEAHGRELFARALMGEFGEIAEPAVLVLERTALLARDQRSALATATISGLQTALSTLQDAIRLNLATEDEVAALSLKQAELDAWCTYRVYLSRVELQEGFPVALDWPNAPTTPFVMEDSPEGM